MLRRCERNTAGNPCSQACKRIHTVHCASVLHDIAQQKSSAHAHAQLLSSKTSRW